MRQAWRELMFADEDQAAKQTRDPVAPAQRSAAALRKAKRQRLEDGTPVHSFATLLAELATIVRNTCRTPMAGDNAPSFRITTTASPSQQRALQLINSITL
jgi:anti-sigma factor RsiW